MLHTPLHPPVPFSLPPTLPGQTPPEPHKAEVREILRRTLEQTLYAEAASSQQADSGSQARLPGPWSAFFEEASPWNPATVLSTALHRDLSGQFDENLIRDLLLAAADIKVARATLPEPKLAKLQSIAERHGLQSVLSPQRWILRPEEAKGTLTHRVQRPAEPGEPNAVQHLYLASGLTLAETARMLDEAGEDDLFGALLGIPKCCRAAFERAKPDAEKHFGLAPAVLDNTPGATPGSAPLDWRLNFLAHFFGPSLLSFVPCSFRCAEAAAIADATLAMLERLDPDWAARCVALQQTNVLATGQHGLHLLRAALHNDTIAYEPGDLLSSQQTALASLLAFGDHLEVSGKHLVTVYLGSMRLARLAGDDVSLCAFH